MGNPIPAPKPISRTVSEAVEYPSTAEIMADLHELEMEITKGFGTKNDEKELIETLDKVFFSEEEEIRFLTLLPKLYKEQYKPAENNIILKEDGVIKAAVGCFPLSITAAGKNCFLSNYATLMLLHNYLRYPIRLVQLDKCGPQKE